MNVRHYRNGTVERTLRLAQMYDFIVINRAQSKEWAIYVGSGYVVHSPLISWGTGKREQGHTAMKELLEEVAGSDECWIEEKSETAKKRSLIELDHAKIKQNIDDALQKSRFHGVAGAPFRNSDHFVTEMKYREYMEGDYLDEDDFVAGMLW